MKTRKAGKGITEIQLRRQDAIGPGGIQHESEVIVLDPPVATDRNGFPLVLNVDQLPVWRLGGHTDGNRVPDQRLCILPCRGNRAVNACEKCASMYIQTWNIASQPPTWRADVWETYRRD